MLGTVRYAAGILLAAGLLAACGKGTPITSGTATPQPTSPPKVVGEYLIGGSNNQPAGLVEVDSTSTVWFTESRTSRIEGHSSWGIRASRVSECANLGQLLRRKGEPSLELGIDLPLHRKVDGNMEERARGRRDHATFTESLHGSS